MYYGKIPDSRRRFIDSVGNGFIIGLASSSTFYFVSGLRGSPRGARLAGGAQAVRANGLRFASWLGAYSAVFFSVETAMSLARRRDDDWNSIAAGAASLGLSQVRRGARAAALYSFIGAAAVAAPLAEAWFLTQWHVTRPYCEMYVDYRAKRRHARWSNRIEEKKL